MTISANMVKELRERTGAGMMECKKALGEANGDMDLAIENMRKSGLAKADKKAGRVAAEGRIAIEQTVDAVAMVEVNCETDFVANTDEFGAFASSVAKAVLNVSGGLSDSINDVKLANGETVDTARRSLVAKIGENVTVRRYERYQTKGGVFGVYSHGSRIGVLVELKGGTPALAKDIAMHVAASRPLCVKPEEVAKEVLDKEREIIRAQSADSGKPEAIIEKMVEGRLKKFLAEVTLLGQPFVKDPDQSVEKLVKSAGAEVLRFTRFEVGEGVEKSQEAA
jgi:elongation factor Ts